MKKKTFSIKSKKKIKISRRAKAKKNNKFLRLVKAKKLAKAMSMMITASKTAKAMGEEAAKDSSENDEQPAKKNIKSAENTSKEASGGIIEVGKTVKENTANTYKSVKSTVKKTAKAKTQTAVNATNSAVKGSVKVGTKSAYNGTKAAVKASKVTARSATRTTASTSKMAAKSAAKAAQASAKTTKAMVQVTVKTAKVLSKAVVFLAKLLAKAMTAIIAAIGPYVAIGILVVIAVTALVGGIIMLADKTGLTNYYSEDEIIEKAVGWQENGEDADNLENIMSGEVQSIEDSISESESISESIVESISESIAESISNAATSNNTTNEPNEDTVRVTGITISQDKLTLRLGYSRKLYANISPANATDQSFVFSSSNPSVATIDSKIGLIKTLAKGQTTITVRSNDGNFVALCILIVN